MNMMVRESDLIEAPKEVTNELSLANFIRFLEGKDPNEMYAYADTSHCINAQFHRLIGRQYNVPDGVLGLRGSHDWDKVKHNFINAPVVAQIEVCACMSPTVDTPINGQFNRVSLVRHCLARARELHELVLAAR